ncbi:MAG: AarF/UbiB family protein [Muribaculaceae bacterium]
MIEIADIKASIQNGTLIQDEFFKNADFLKDSRGRLISYTGGYTVVIPCNVNGEQWAFRCWHIPVKDSKERYSYISRAIQNCALPFFCSFDYNEKGLIVKGETLPITKMKWVNGQNLKKFICSHYQESKVIKKLAKNFLDMIIQLHSKHIAHGDLQHGNIIVSDSAKIYLVDYDSMYVPQMGHNFHDIISGLIDYQHPSRKNNSNSSEKLDYFSELIIYTSLLVIAKKPEFVLKYDIENTEALLFKSNDFESFDKSEIYQDLKELNSSEIDLCLKIITEYLSLDDINLLEPIESYLMTIEIDYPQIVPIDESFVINWKSDGVKTIEVSDYGKVGLHGSLKFKLTTNKTISFELTSKSGFKSRKTIAITVAHRAVINEFKADKLFTYDDIPVRLSWNCSNAKKIEIKTIGQQVQNGSILVTPKTETTYTLCVEDDFGILTQSLTIKILPLPVIKQLWVPAPNINKNIGIIYKAPKFKLSIPTPSYGTVFSKIELPKIPERSKSLYYIHRIETTKKSGFGKIFQSLFSIFAKKK